MQHFISRSSYLDAFWNTVNLDSLDLFPLLQSQIFTLPNKWFRLASLAGFPLLLLIRNWKMWVRRGEIKIQRCMNWKKKCIRLLEEAFVDFEEDLISIMRQGNNFSNATWPGKYLITRLTRQTKTCISSQIRSNIHRYNIMEIMVINQEELYPFSTCGCPQLYCLYFLPKGSTHGLYNFLCCGRGSTACKLHNIYQTFTITSWLHKAA